MDKKTDASDSLLYTARARTTVIFGGRAGAESNTGFGFTKEQQRLPVAEENHSRTQK
jgi:hypothetical protein